MRAEMQSDTVVQSLEGKMPEPDVGGKGKPVKGFKEESDMIEHQLMKMIFRALFWMGGWEYRKEEIAVKSY